MSEEPSIQYAPSSDGHLAYQVLGEGSIDLLRIDDATMASIDSISDEPHRDRFDLRLASFARVVRFDRRGIGLSDGHSALAPMTLEQAATDVCAVLDAAGSKRAAVFGATTAIVVGATSPERATHLLLFNATARLAQAADYPWGLSQAYIDSWVGTVPNPAQGDERIDELEILAPSLASDPLFRAHWSRSGQRGASPAIARAQLETIFRADVRTMLPSIRVPTSVMYSHNALLSPEHTEYLATHIPNARMIKIPGRDLLFYGDGADAAIDEMEEVLTGSRGGAAAQRVLTTVLFTDVVQSTERLVSVGDRAWRTLLDRHDALVRAELTRFGGREVSTAGDSFFAVFDGPARAIRCAQAIVDGTDALGIDVRAGIHTGECDVRGNDYGGIAVHIGARVAALAGAREVLATSTVKDLVAGSGIAFADHGFHQLKGVSEAWHIFRVRPPGRGDSEST